MTLKIKNVVLKNNKYLISIISNNKESKIELDFHVIDYYKNHLIPNLIKSKNKLNKNNLILKDKAYYEKINDKLEFYSKIINMIEEING